MGLVGRLWCLVMRLLDRYPLYCTSAYAVSVVHCWFLGAMGFRPTRRAYTDLLLLPYRLLKPAEDSCIKR